MDAYISGTAGVAAIVKGDTTELYRVDNNGASPIKTSAAHQMLSSYDDVISLKQTNKQDAIKKLRSEKNKVDCLMLFLTFLDSSVDIESKLPIAEHLNGIFDKDISAYEYLCNVMFTRPLPDNSIKSVPDNFPSIDSRVGCLLSSLFSSQSKIKECNDLFNSICDKRKLDLKQSDYVEGVLVNQSFFHSFGSQQADRNFLNNIIFTLTNNLKNFEIPSYVQFVSCIRTEFSPLTISTKSTQKSFHQKIKEEEQEERQKVNYQVKAKKETNRKVYERVLAQLTAIKKQLRSDSIDSAKRLAVDLIKSQVSGGGNEFAAQSLCQLSEFAKNLHLFELQLEWALSASDLAPFDYRCYGHVADAYINLESIDDAKTYFEKCLDAQDDNRVYGLIGLARIERARGDLTKAMEHIQAAVVECGRDSTPYIIKAELLRDQYKYSESQEVYEFVTREFSELARAVCGKAAVLVDQKKFEEAEEVYRFALKNYPNTEDKCVTLSSLGFLLARLGRFKESYKLLDESIGLSEFEHVIPSLSKANALQMEGKLKVAENVLLKLFEGRKSFVDIAEQLLDLYIKNAKLDEAQELYKNLEPGVKESNIVQIRYSQLLMQKHNYEEALKVVDVLKADNPKYIFALNQRAAILKTQGHYNQALSQYKQVLEINKFEHVASVGVQAINYIFNRRPDESCVSGMCDVANPKTIEDYQVIGELGLMKLSNGDAKEAKKLLLQAKNCNFKSIQTKFSSGLSLASLTLGQNKVALKTIKKGKNNIAYIQKAVVYGELGDVARVKASLKQVSLTRHPYIDKVIEMITAKYINAANDDVYSQEDIYHEQLKNMLIAA